MSRFAGGAAQGSDDAQHRWKQAEGRGADGDPQEPNQR